MLEIVSRLADDVSGSKARAAARVQGAEACSVLYDQILHSLMFPPQPAATATTPALPASAMLDAAAQAAPQAATEGALIAEQRAYASRLQVIDHGRNGLAANAWPLIAAPSPANEPGTALATRSTTDDEPMILPWEQLLARMALQQRLSG